MFQEEGYYFVTSRCVQERLLLRPSATGKLLPLSPNGATRRW
ncbi:hypothetical protein ACN28S_13350 [Cystobacter fuscus]